MTDTPLVKIEDVARAAGVSIMSVSRALRGVEGVSEATRLRITGIAAELGYVSNRLAGSLAQATSTLVCISVPRLYDAVFPEIIAGMRQTLLHAGLETIIETSDYDPAREAAWVRRMIEWSPAGLVLTGVDHAPEVRDRLTGAGIPVLEIWDTAETIIDMNVGVDHRAAGLAMGRHLTTLGYRRPAYVGIARGRDTRSEKRMGGLAAGFRESGIALDVIRADAPPSFEAGHIVASEALARDRRPDVLCCLHDHLAIGALMAATNAGVAVPEDLGVVGFNGLNINNVLPRPLTTSVTPRDQMGLAAARMLVAATRGVRTERRLVMPVEIETGATTRGQQSRLTRGSGSS